MKLSKLIFLVSLLGMFGFSWPFDPATPNAERFGSNSWINRETQIIQSKAGNIDTRVLRLSLIAYLHARQQGMDNKGMLTVIDFSKPSNEKRLWVFDLKNNRTVFNTYVAHGKNSGGQSATSFSNSPGSLKSSIGVFLTAEPYVGGHGLSLRLRGLERGINDNAYNRDIVIHGARYVNASQAQQRGMVGRSWGCPAVSESLATPIINKIKDNTLVFAYYPDRSWLNHSRFLSA